MEIWPTAVIVIYEEVVPNWGMVAPECARIVTKCVLCLFGTFANVVESWEHMPRECPYNNTFSLYFLDQLAANMMVGPAAGQVSSISMQLKVEIFLLTNEQKVQG